MKALTLGLILSIILGCGQKFESVKISRETSSKEGTLPQPDPEPIPEPNPPLDSLPLEICSKLDFENVQWSTELSYAERNAFALALNISGSFEGSSGWANLTNNFDGQGLSFGLLNQTLGTGSLQPLLHKFSIQYPELGESIFGESRWSDLLKMLSRWSQNFSPSSLTHHASLSVERIFVGSGPDQDKYYFLRPDGLTMQSSRNQESVQWALANLYTDSSGLKFRSEWKSAFKQLGILPEYISLQVQAAERLHYEALDDFNTLSFEQLKSYLFLFDIVVQNGGLRNSHIQEFFNWRSSHPGSNETDQALELLEIRVLSSLPQWREDVRKRKKTILLGTGLVHGASRNLPDEYCYSLQSLLFGS